MPSTRTPSPPQSASAPEGRNLVRAGWSPRAVPDRLTVHTEEAMITGTVNPDPQATIWLPVCGLDEREREIKAFIEGFDGFMTLPPAVTIALDLDLHPMAPREVIESGEEAR